MRGPALARRADAMRPLFAMLMATTLVACGLDDGAPDGGDLEDVESADDLAGIGGDDKMDGEATWTDIGLGVAYQRVNTGNAIVIAYGGYSAKLSYSAAWVSELVDQALGAADVGHVYAVKGPQDAGYNAKEIANSKLRAHLATFDDGVSPIYIVAHSSGAFVAHEILNQWHNKGMQSVLARVRYANLDGGGSGLNTTLVGELDMISFVYAKDPTLARGLSQNAGAAVALGQTYRMYGGAFEVTQPNTGCNSGAGWCLHDVVITQKPHDPNTYNLALDYTDFVDRPVTTAYLDPFIATE
ncbi:MAG: hypothetical protein AB7L94_32300 [Kofleriaceae bacterium]